MVPAVEGSNERLFWTFALVEEKLVEAWGYLMRMPDRERGWLQSCARSSMPAVVRSVREGDYMETRTGRTGLRSAQVDVLDMVLLGSGAWIEWVGERDRPLVATVLKVMSWDAGGFTWSDVAEEVGWIAGPDALRMRYNRAVARIAGKLNVNKVQVF